MTYCLTDVKCNIAEEQRSFSQASHTTPEMMEVSETPDVEGQLERVSKVELCHKWEEALGYKHVKSII